MKINIIILLLSFSFLTKAQEKDSTNIYFKALKIHLNRWKKYSIESPNIYKLPAIYFIEQDDYSTKNFPLEIDNQKIQILSRKEIIQKTKTEKSFSIICIRPAMWDNGNLVVNIIDYGVSMKKRKLFYSNAGGSVFKIISNKDSEQLKLKLIYHGQP